jgi:phosphoglucosamine mutase|tara:strand:- start:12196 stop:13542 length:1347 start_codon:yes stop_codon:yes gene_type:complete
MAKSFFGTDGIRGTVNTEDLNSEIALKLGIAAGKIFTRGNHKHRVIIGKDTRVSGYMLESALESGFTSSGMDVFLTGPIPTPAVAYLTRALRADLGVMITASHNTYEDNGFKLFGPNGLKLSDNKQFEIEELMNREDIMTLQDNINIGVARRVDDALSRYTEFAKASFPNLMRLDNIKIVLDCANGATYKVAPKIFWELGADIVVIGDKPNGRNINQDYGTTNTENLKQKVLDEKADLGISFDGDGDRLVLIDNSGNQVDGDHLLAMIALSLKNKNKLKNDKVISTIMSNNALENYLKEIGIELIRSQVGDRYVIEDMIKHDTNFGGEPSGHIILSDYSTTGDALIAALNVLALMCEENKSISELTNLFILNPQNSDEFRHLNINAISDSSIEELSNEMVKKMKKKGRVIIRKSGTEPIIRIMVESEDKNMNRNILSHIESSLENLIK